MGWRAIGEMGEWLGHAVTVKMNVPLGDGSAKAWGETGCTVWDEWSQQ